MSSTHPAPKPPPTKEPTDSEISDPPTKRSRSQSRRARRRKAQQNAQRPKNQHMPSLDEDVAQEDEEEEDDDDEAKPGATTRSLQRISGDETSMPGPVTNARAQRGELPIRGGKQPGAAAQKGGGGPSDEMMKQDGLKLRLELNLDIELELKASIRGDVTLALLA